MDNSQQDPSNVSDRVAITLSGLCMLHCLALPLLLVTVPLFEVAAQDHFHLQMLIIIIPVSVYALYRGYIWHGHLGTMIWAAIGMTLLIIGASWAHAELGANADRLFTISGSITLAVAHYVNSRKAKRHRSQQAAQND